MIHLDLGKGWRGGQQQAVYLHRGLVDRGVKSLFLCPSGSPASEKLCELGLPFRPFNALGELDLFSGARLAAMALREGFGIIHAHCSHSLSIAIWAGMFNPGLRTVGSRRVDFPVGKNPFSRYKYASSRVDRIICVSRAVERVMKESGVSSKKLVTIHSGVHPERFFGVRSDPDFRRRLGIPSNHLLVGTIAALVGHKGYPGLLRAAAISLKENPEMTFLALGRGGMKGYLKKLADELGLGSSFRFLGFRPDPLEYLVNFDLFVLASKEEGLGTSLLDAMMLGVPVIGTDAGGIPEAVRNGVNGILVPRDDHGALAEAILALAADSGLRERLGEGGRRVVMEFSVERTVTATLGVYQEQRTPDE